MNLIVLLQTLPDVVILLVVLTIVASLAVLAPYFGRYMLRLRPNDGRDSAAFDAFKVVMGTTGLVLAFSLVQAMTNLRTSEAMVGREATAFAAVDRTLLRSGIPDAAAARPLLAQYGQARVDIEWPGLARGERNATASERYTALSQAVRSLQPADQRQQSMFAELLRSMDDLAELREATIQNTGLNLPIFFWITAVAQLGVAICLACMANITPARLVSLGGSAAALSLLFALLVVVDHPYGGDTGVHPNGIIQILDVNARRS